MNTFRADNQLGTGQHRHQSAGWLQHEGFIAGKIIIILIPSQMTIVETQDFFIWNRKTIMLFKRTEKICFKLKVTSHQTKIKETL